MKNLGITVHRLLKLEENIRFGEWCDAQMGFDTGGIGHEVYEEFAQENGWGSYEELYQEMEKRIGAGWIHRHGIYKGEIV